MNHSPHHRLSAACALLVLVASAPSKAHVTLPAGGAPAGSTYDAPFRVGHACAGSTSTTGVTVRLPEGFTLADAQPRAGWTLTKSAREVSWEANSSQSALPTAEKADFVVRGRLTERPGTLWFKVLQTCDKGRADWADMPGASVASMASGASEAARLALPAARLDVLAAGIAAVDIRDAWSRPVAATQGTAVVYAKFLAPAGARLVGVDSPVSESGEIHEMRMDGDVMRMRALENGVELAAGKGFELAPGGYHAMLHKLRRPLALGESFTVTFRFVDPAGRAVGREARVEVRNTGEPAGSEHRH